MTPLAKLGIILAATAAYTLTKTVYENRMMREAWREFELRMELNRGR